MQRALMQYRNPHNRKLVLEALRISGRNDLIGYGPKCLIHPENGHERTAADGDARPRRTPGRRGR
jgi:hypothetical protein